MPNHRPEGGRRPGRFQVPPPAILRSEGEPYEGFDVLDEVVGRDGLLLCECVRDLMLWLAAPEEHRAKLFAPESWPRRRDELAASSLPDYLKLQLKTLIRILDPEAGVTPADLATPCRRITRWAEEHDWPRTAIAFAQTAALSLPRNAEHAFHVGRLCRRNAQYARAESWYRRAVALGRKQDAQSYARAWMGLGNLAVQRGNFPAAERAFLKALRRARRAGLRPVRAEALHDLFSVCAESRRTAEAEVYARRAARAYGRRHPRLPALAHDVAGFWLLQGFFERSLRVFQALVNLFPHPTARLQVLANTARAAGGAQQKYVFLDCWIEVSRMVDSRKGGEYGAAAMLNLAYGSAHLSDWERAELAARSALDLAKEQGQKQVEAEAETLLVASVSQQFTASYLPSPDDREIVEAADALAEDFVRKLAVRVEDT